MRLRAPHELLEQNISSGKQAAFEGQLSNLYRDALEELLQYDKGRVISTSFWCYPFISI
jgi:hypothetical protein